LIACLATPFILFSLGKIEAALLFALLAALVWYKHRANIGRLFAGTEPKIGASK
jgi:glycerol-3-phosphate acyltransferase PlsY